MPLLFGSVKFRAPLPSESHAFVDCVEESFHIRYSDEQRGRFIAGLNMPLALVGVIEDKIIATLAGHYLTQTLVGTRQLRTLALTDIGVITDARGHGVFRSLVDRCLVDAQRRGDVLAVLSTEHPDLYSRHGFGRASSGYSQSIALKQPVDLEYSIAERSGQDAEGIVHLTSTEALGVIDGVFAALNTARPGELERPLPLIEELLVPATNFSEREIIGLVQKGQFIGYAVFEQPRPTPRGDTGALRVLEVAGLTHEASINLWRCLIELGNGTVECVELPGEEPIFQSFFDVVGFGPVSRTARTFNRLIDVQLALESRGYRGAQSLVVDVDDPILPENSGTWKIVTNNAGTANVARTTEQSEITLSMALLATLFSGEADNADLMDDPTCIVHRRGAEHSAIDLFAADLRPYCTALC